MHGRTVHSNAMANQSRTTLYLALACQSFARPLRFIELRFHELHFLCITPPICALLCPSFSLRVKTSPHHCLSKLCCAYLAVALHLTTLPLLCHSLLDQSMPFLCLALAIRCLSTLGRCESMSINAVPLPNKSTLYFALAYALTFIAKPHYVVPLLCCPNQHLRTSQPFTGSLCRSLCYPELSHCHSVPFIANPLHCKSKLCRRCFRRDCHHHSYVHAPICAGL